MKYHHHDNGKSLHKPLEVTQAIAFLLYRLGIKSDFVALEYEQYKDHRLHLISNANILIDFVDRMIK